MVRFFAFVFACFLTLPSSAAGATTYDVLPEQSRISFHGTHAGQNFTGVFEQWQADIVFDPENPGESRVHVTLPLRAAKTGNHMYDSALPQADWFDVKNDPDAVFTSTALAPGAEKGIYRMTGNLTLRGITRPVSFDFSFATEDDGRARVKARFTLDRLDYGIGRKSDAEAEWVGREIDITLDLLAHPRT